jgi:hypothetical protein
MTNFKDWVPLASVIVAFLGGLIWVNVAIAEIKAEQNNQKEEIGTLADDIKPTLIFLAADVYTIKGQVNTILSILKK